MADAVRGWAWRSWSPAVRRSAFARIWTDWIGPKGSYPTPFGVIKLEHKRLPDGSIRTAVQAPPEIELVYENAGTGIS